MRARTTSLPGFAARAADSRADQQFAASANEGSADRAKKQVWVSGTCWKFDNLDWTKPLNVGGREIGTSRGRSPERILQLGYKILSVVACNRV